MLYHPVGCRLSKALGVVVDERLLVVVCLCVIDQSFAVTFHLGERGVSSAIKLVLNMLCQHRRFRYIKRV